ncbi:MAG: hypothetical protein ABGZ35_20180 [Planctomycetaceae bacterium]
MHTVYVETSIGRHATAWPRSDIQITALQQQARRSLSIERPNFELRYVSTCDRRRVYRDLAAAVERLQQLNGLPMSVHL